MPRRDRPRWWAALASALLAALGLSGCAHGPTRPKEHDSARILDSGLGGRVTARQAADVQFAVGRSSEAEGQFDKAESAYLAAVAKDPRRADAESRLAILADRKGDSAAADRHFARALKLNPKDAETLCDQGYSLYLRRRWADAESSLTKAIALDRSHSRAHTNLGLVLARRGERDKALAEFARAGCDPADARSNLALVLAMDGHLEDAREQYALALKAKPASASAREGLRVASAALAGTTRSIAKAGAVADPAVRRTSGSE